MLYFIDKRTRVQCILRKVLMPVRTFGSRYLRTREPSGPRVHDIVMREEGKQMPSRKRASAKRKSSALHARRLSQLDLLAMEAYSVLCSGLTLYGISVERQRVLFRQSCGKLGKVTPVSAQLLEQFHSVSELLTTWLQELPYVDATGRPKVLPIRGRGATFESLARQFLPERSVDEVVDLARQVGTVDTLSGERIAVYGDPMINIAENPEATLAQAIQHITNIIQTVDFNAKRGRRRDRSIGRFERLVYEQLTAKQFEIFRKSIRPQLDALCEHAGRVLKKLARDQARNKRRLGGAGIGVYVYHRNDGGSKPRARPRARVARRR